MSPEYGSTCAVFPIDAETLRYLELSGRPREQIELVEAYAKEQGLWRSANVRARYSDVLSLDLGAVEPSLAGPKRPQDRIRCARPPATDGTELLEDRGQGHGRARSQQGSQTTSSSSDGAVVIAAITSCTNTSNPAVMVGAGSARAQCGREGPRAQAVGEDEPRAGLQGRHRLLDGVQPARRSRAARLQRRRLRLHDLHRQLAVRCPSEIADGGQENDVVACAVLSGNRNFEGRIHPQVKMNYLASPPLVVAYALAGNMKVDLYTEPLGHDKRRQTRSTCATSGRAAKEIHDLIRKHVTSAMFKSSYASVFDGDENWNGLEVPSGETFTWSDDSTYVKNPPYFDGMTLTTSTPQNIRGARVLAMLGDSVTTDHISPAGSIAADSPAGRYLIELGVQKKDFNSYGSRRGNHEVMMRGTFANIRLRNKLAPGTEGGWTIHLPTGEQMSIYDAAMRYQADGTPLLVLAGKEYGAGSSRDWAAKGTALLGVRAVIAESYERIHRSNLVGMGVVPLQYRDGETPRAWGSPAPRSTTSRAWARSASKR